MFSRSLDPLRRLRALWRHAAAGIRVLVRRTDADRQLDEEVGHYLDESIAAHAARGLSPEEARRAAFLDIGNPTVMRDQVRGYGWENIVSTTWADGRYAARRLRGAPGFTSIAVATLALGIGASTAIFSAVNPILFEPLPYPASRQIATVWDFRVDRSPLDVTFGTYRELLERSRSFDALAVMKAWQPTLTGEAEPERLDGQRVTTAYFRALGIPPRFGREFDAAEDRVNGANVVVLGSGLWRRRFGADPSIVGRTITLNDTSFTVVGVMPDAFENVLAPSAEIWAPLQYDPSLPPEGREWGHHLRMVARLRPDVSPDRAEAELGRIARDPLSQFPRVPWASMRQGLTVHLLKDDVTRGVKPALLAIFGAVFLLLAIASVNVTSLLLARGAQRRGEFAMRAALGAGRARLLRQVLTESLLLAVLGGALGMVIAELGVRALVALSPAGLPRVNAIRLDSTVFIFGTVLTTVVGLAFGLVPALHAARRDVHDNIQQSSVRTAGGDHLTRRVLVVAEVGLAIVLLVSAGLLLRSLQRLFSVAPGFTPSHVLTMQVQVSERRFRSVDAVHRFFDATLDAVHRVPGIVSAAYVSQLPLSGDFVQYGVQFESRPNDDPREDGSALRYAVTAGYFETLGISLKRGRLLDAHDSADAPATTVINESFARRKLGKRDPIGQRVRIGDSKNPWSTIVGVVADVKQTSLALGDSDAVYTTTAQWGYADNPLWLVVRTQGDPAALAPAVRRAIWSVDKDQPVVRVATMDDLVAASAAERRFALILFEAFALVALVLAATGMYGVLSGSVSERTREIGVRSALGASRVDILAMIMREGLSLTSAGVAVGLAVAFAATRWLASLLFGISALDPVTYVGVIALLCVASAIACAVPAWRAARVDPSLTLRAI